MKTILKRLNIKDEEMFLLAVASALLGLFYLVWRLVFTIDYSAPLIELVWPFTLLIAETYSFAVFFMFSIVIMNNRTFETHINPKDINYFPTVDIFICTYNESKDLLYDTVLGCKSIKYKENNNPVKTGEEEKVSLREAINRCKGIDYKNKKIYLLDDGHREEMKKLAEDMGTNYISRENNVGFKAGNINNAVKKTDGEFIVIFDADHIPVSTFLLELIDYFKDEKVALVQTPQYFFNPDSFQKNLRLFKQLTNEQDLFFRVLQPGLSDWNSIICCGTNFIIRRDSLNRVGGFPEGSVTEDMDLGMRLLGLGLVMKYYNKPLAAGLAPESFQQYVNQRLRWCAGNLQTFLFNVGKSFKKLSFLQRCFYLSGISYYFFGFPRLVFILSPILYLLFGVKPLFALLPEVGLFIVVIYIVKINIFNKVAAQYRNFFFTDVYETSIAFYLSLTVIKTFLNPHNIKFKITSKGAQGTSVNFMLYLPQLILFIGSILAVIVPFYQLYKHIFSMEALVLNMFFNFYNMVILFFAVRVVFEKVEKRKEQRITVDLQADLEDKEHNKMNVEVVNLSKRGALLFSRRKKEDEFESIFEESNNLILPENENVEIKILNSYKKDGGKYYHVKFNLKSKEQEDEILKIAFKNSNNWK